MPYGYGSIREKESHFSRLGIFLKIDGEEYLTRVRVRVRVRGEEYLTRKMIGSGSSRGGW